MDAYSLFDGTLSIPDVPMTNTIEPGKVLNHSLSITYTDPLYSNVSCTIISFCLWNFESLFYRRSDGMSYRQW